jgi:hypothetical protein
VNKTEKLYHTGSSRSTPVVLTLAPWAHFTLSINNPKEESQGKRKTSQELVAVAGIFAMTICQCQHTLTMEVFLEG